MSNNGVNSHEVANTSSSRIVLSSSTLTPNRSPGPYSPPTQFPLVSLPREVRDKIFAHELALGPLMEIPALLIVLGTSKTWSEDYQEAQKMYRSQNHVVNVKNQKEFINMDRKKRMAIRYLRLNVQQMTTNPIQYLKLRNARAFCLNDFETLTVDLTGGAELFNERGDVGGVLRDFFASVDYMRTASLHGVRTVFVIMDCGVPIIGEIRGAWKLALGPGRQNKTLRMMNGKQVELTTWQRNERRVPVRVCRSDRFRYQ
ncbi:hypothetical protein IFR05_010537 [Cadophora sp. M221]|nr:hypothetical protein IFR05_010537 [Cadophora sp. M221]